ncbi:MULTISPECIES: LuxR C-terminal-related transcriptional regulator [unclassified Streptomyces]|uniref:LuxR C-terminal-related transcriptional regulator n=1 Tax=unclassified Streptomyces TaxID=2593676 RepID=UPI00093E0982|nr:LuxR C-terminal-related transcriptional regulator [Streptomyces sp. CB02400]OKK07138.1 hypothetical protein AMK33_19535 [Streptomyces sp. CB02400]
MDSLSQADELERRILQLLYEGYDDARVGRELGMAHRTVQRRVRSLMVRLNVNGRFALGARAQELGWIDVHGTGAGRSAADAFGNTVADAA